MKLSSKLTLLASAITTVLQTGSAIAAQTDNNNAKEDIENIMVVGVRSSIISSVTQKRDSNIVSDVITAEDIGKFPDVNVAESLQRIPGIQISRSRGEASGVSIRGLDEIATLLNGRNYFGGSSEGSINRFASFEDIPAELVGSVNVYKSVSADLLEGGIGGVVDLERTNSLRLNGFTLAGSLKEHYGDLSDNWSPRGSLVTGNVWDYGDNGGKFGVIFGLSYVERSYREDLVRNSSSDPIVGSFPTGGTAPDGAKATKSLNSSPAWGDRERTVYSLGLDWALDRDTKFHFDGGYTEYETAQLRQEFVWTFDNANITDADFSNIDANHLYPKSVTFSDMTFDTLSMINDRVTTTYDYALGFETKLNNLAITSELSYVDTDNDTQFRNTRIRDNKDQLPVTVNNSGFPSKPPTIDFGSFDVNSFNNFNIVQWRNTTNQLAADETAAKVDLDYTIAGGFFSSLEAGIRLAQLNSSKYRQDNHVFDESGDTYGTTDPLNIVEKSRWSDFMAEYDGANFPKKYIGVNPEYLASRDAAIRAQYGIKKQSEIDNPRDSFEYKEDVSSFYIKANFQDQIASKYISGNFGMRVVKTDTTADYFFETGNMVNGQTEYSAKVDKKDYVEYLPSVNLKVELTDELLVRFAASKTFSRPHLGDMAPSLNLNYEQSTGSGGNPDLEPFHAKNLDLSLEYYFDEGGLISSTIFHKKVDGFLQTTKTNEQIGNQVFEMSRKANGGSGTAQGLELSYQQFFTQLPAPFDGLGVQANYTYVDSDVPSPNPELPNIALEGLSDNSYNLVGIYEKDNFSGRLSYNYRSDFLISSVEAQEGFGQLDASFSYNINEHFRLTFDAINLLRRDHFEYKAGDENNPYHWISTEKQFIVGISYKM